DNEGLHAFGCGKRTGKATVGIVGATDEGAELADLEAQAPNAARRTGPGIGALPLVGEDVRTKQVVQRIEPLGNPQIADIVHRADELAPEVTQHVLPFQLARRDEVELFLKVGGEVVFDIAAEEAFEESRYQAPLVLWVQSLLDDADIFTVAQHVQRRGIGGRPADAELL